MKSRVNSQWFEFCESVKAEMAEKGKMVTVIVLGLLCGNLLGASVQDGEYYVSVSGADGNSGTLTNPLRTIQKAPDSVVAGDTVFIREGTYSERVVVKRSGTADRNITITAFENEAVTIDGSGVDVPSDSGLLAVEQRQYIQVLNLRIQNSSAAGIRVDSSENILIQGNPANWTHFP